MAPSQVCPSPPFVLPPEWTVGTGFVESGDLCLLGLVLLIIALLSWIDHSARLALCRCFIAFMDNRMSASLTFLGRCVKTAVFKTWKVACVCCSAVYPLLFSSTHIYHQKVQGCNGWAHLGGLACCSLIHGHHGPLPLWYNIACTKQMTPPGQWMGPFYLFFGPFFKWKERNSAFLWATFQRGLEVCIFRCKLLRVELCACVLDLACTWIWFRWRDLDLGSKVRPQPWSRMNVLTLLLVCFQAKTGNCYQYHAPYKVISGLAFHNPRLFKYCEIYWLFLSDFIVSSSEILLFFLSEPNCSWAVTHWNDLWPKLFFFFFHVQKSFICGLMCCANGKRTI